MAPLLTSQNVKFSTLPSGMRAPAFLRKALVVLNLAIALVMAADLPAQDRPNKASVTTTKEGAVLYSIKFNGGRTEELASLWREALPNDNFVMTESAERPILPPFELHNARLVDIARSIAFLSEGALTVEVRERDATTPGNIWRIGTPSSSSPPFAVGMRAVAAPHLFADHDNVQRLLKEAEQIENDRIDLTRSLGKTPQRVLTKITPLSAQKVFVIMGAEEGIAAVESLIKACERAADPGGSKDSKSAQ